MSVVISGTLVMPALVSKLWSIWVCNLCAGIYVLVMGCTHMSISLLPLASGQQNAVYYLGLYDVWQCDLSGPWRGFLLVGAAGTLAIAIPCVASIVGPGPYLDLLIPRMWLSISGIDPSSPVSLRDEFYILRMDVYFALHAIVLLVHVYLQSLYFHPKSTQHNVFRLVGHASKVLLWILLFGDD